MVQMNIMSINVDYRDLRPETDVDDALCFLAAQ